MELTEKEVYFGEYCLLCKFKDCSEEDDPCNECLTYPTNTNSHKPVNFEETEP